MSSRERGKGRGRESSQSVERDDLSVSEVSTTGQTHAPRSKQVYAPSDLQALESYHQFLRDDEEDMRNYSRWEIRMARSYYDQLYKEFAIADLSRYKEGKIGEK